MARTEKFACGDCKDSMLEKLNNICLTCKHYDSIRHAAINERCDYETNLEYAITEDGEKCVKCYYVEQKDS